MARRRNSFKRKERGLRALPAILIVCEGSKTEPNYFRGIKKQGAATNATILIHGGRDRTDPLSIVEFTVSELNKYSGVEMEAWAVFDRDDHDQHRFRQALDKAKAHRIEIALSNPCFELWYLLHFRNQSGHIERQKLLSVLRQCPGMENYEKGEAYLPRLMDREGQAGARAQQLRDKHERDGRKDPLECNPSTKVDLLVARLRSFETPAETI